MREQNERERMERESEIERERMEKDQEIAELRNQLSRAASLMTPQVI